MAKVIKYKFLSAEINYGTVENPDIEQVFLDKTIFCPTQSVYDANYPLAEKEAVPGTIEIVGEFEDEVSPTDAQRIAELEEALDMLLSGVTE